MGAATAISAWAPLRAQPVALIPTRLAWSDPATGRSSQFWARAMGWYALALVDMAGLGGNPYRNGSYAYYISERVGADDAKSVGPFILASLEFER